MTDQVNGVVRPLPGDGVVARAGDLLLVCDAPDAVVEDLITALRETAAAGGDGTALARRAAQVLARSMMGEPVACAVAGPSSGGIAVLVSGSASASVGGGPDGAVQLSGRDALTWTDRLVGGPVSKVELRLPGAGKANQHARLDGGVIAGAGLIADYSGAGSAPSMVSDVYPDSPNIARPAPSAVSRAEPLRRPPEAVPAREQAPPPARPAEPAPPLPPLPVPPPIPRPSVPSVPEPTAEPFAGPAPRPVPGPAQGPGVGPPPGPMPGSMEGPMSGPSGPMAGSRPYGGGPHDEGTPGPGANGMTGEPQPGDIGPDKPFVAELLLPAQEGQPGRPGQPGQQAPPREYESTEHMAEPEARPMVYGVDCKNDHFNDPRVPYCAVCGIALVQRTLVPYKGPRPPLGVLLLDDGMTLRLDTDYVVGRDPERAGEVLGGEARPAKVTSPDGSVSRRHLRVKLDGWDVNLIDLASVNGTQVQPPGDPNFYDIPPNEAVAILPGTTVRIGVSRTMRYESHRNS